MREGGKLLGRLVKRWICSLKQMKGNNSVTPLTFRAVATRTAGPQRVKQIIVSISNTVLCRACVHSAVKGHLSGKIFRETQRERASSRNTNCRE